MHVQAKLPFAAAMRNTGKQPQTWSDYERGFRSDSFGSTDSGRVHWDEPHRRESGSTMHADGQGHPGSSSNLQHRRWV